MPNDGGTSYNQHAYVKRTARLRKQAYREGATCWQCGHGFDPDCDYRSRWYLTFDHLDPLSLGGKLTGEVKPAHRGCNAARGNGTYRQPKPAATGRPHVEPGREVLEDGYPVCPHHTVGDPSRRSCPHSRKW